MRAAKGPESGPFVFLIGSPIALRQWQPSTADPAVNSASSARKTAAAVHPPITEQLPQTTEQLAPATREQLPPPAWYLDPWGMGWRWWDGLQWTGYFEADPRATVSPPSRSASSSRDWLGLALVGVLVLIGVALIVVAALKFA